MSSTNRGTKRNEVEKLHKVITQPWGYGKQHSRKGMTNMSNSISPYKPIVDRKIIIEQAENKNMSVWEFLKGFVDDEGVIVKEECEDSWE